jgi:ribosomal protein S7
MGGKFRVKAEGGGQLEAVPVLRRNRRRINEPLRFLIRKKRSRSRKTLFTWQIGCDTRQ